MWATHIYNVTPHPVTNNKSPLELLFNHKHDLRKLRVWGCDALVQLAPSEHTKIGSRTWTGVLIGWDKASSSYRIMRLSDRRVFATRNAQFIEDKFDSIRQLEPPNGTLIDPYTNNDDDQHNDAASSAQRPPTPIWGAPQAMPATSVSMGVSGCTELSSAGTDPPTERNDSNESIDRNSNENNDRNSNQSDPEPNFDDGSEQSEIDTEVAQPPAPQPQDGAAGMGESDPDHPMPQEWDALSVSNSDDPNVRNSHHGRGQADESNGPAHPMPPQRDDPSSSDVDTSVPRSRYGREIKPTQSLLNNFDAYGKDALSFALSDREHLQTLHEEFAHLFLMPLYLTDELACAATECVEQEPLQYKDALRSPAYAQWRKAMEEEYQSLISQRVFSLVRRPKGAKVLKGRWVYKIKLGPLNEVLRRKARFVIKGFMQTYGRDYTDTHSPVARMKSIKLLFSIAAWLDLEIHQLDFDTAFLNAPVDEEIYMEQPEGFNAITDPDLVLRLHKSLYGLKQASRNWNLEIHKFLIKIEYVQLKSDPCIYIKKSRTGRKILLALYVDDTIIAVHRDDLNEWYTDKSVIGGAYAIKDLGECQWVLNMKLTRDRTQGTITLSQEAYINRVVADYGMKQTRSVSTPAENCDLTSRPVDGTEPVPLNAQEHERYRSLVGALLYAANITRLDIAYIVGVLARHVSQPCRHHLRAAQRVLIYLRHNSTLTATFGAADPNTPKPSILAYSDADWGGDKELRQSTTGGLIRFNDDVISWISKKQKTIALSSTESEYIALTETTKEVRWLQQWVIEVLGTAIKGIIKCDNQAAILLTAADTIHDRTKHFDLKVHFIREQINTGNVAVEWVPTEEQHADIFTKPLPPGPFLRLRDSIMLNGK